MSNLMDRIESAYEEWFLNTHGQLPKQLVAENEALQRRVAELEKEMAVLADINESFQDALDDSGAEADALNQRVAELGAMLDKLGPILRDFYVGDTSNAYEELNQLNNRYQRGANR